MTTAAPPASPAPPQVLLAHHLRQLKLRARDSLILSHSLSQKVRRRTHRA